MKRNAEPILPMTLANMRSMLPELLRREDHPLALAPQPVRDPLAPLAQVARRPGLPGACPRSRRGAAAAILASANISQAPRAADVRERLSTSRRGPGQQDNPAA
jgi:hypothetical protein